ncbi:MAG: glycosyltransferase [Flavobacteriales bacterium]|nr:glycosyltransferase [Flavobacteriales bacterium]
MRQMKHMHVLVLPKWYPGRHDPQLGDFIRKQTLAVALQHRVSVVAVIALPGSTERFAEELEEREGAWELRCYYTPSKSAWLGWRKTVNLWRYWTTGMRGLRRVWRERGAPDLVHVQIMVRPALLAFWLRLRHRIPYIISEQSSEYLDGTWASKNALFKAINYFLFRRASAVTAVGPTLAEAITAHGLFKNVEVVPNVVPGLDLPLPAAGPAHRFMVVADLVDRTKNVSGVLRALASCRERGIPAELDIIGDGTDEKMLREQAHALGLNGGVRFHGRISNSEVLRHMAGTGSVIINSNVETFSVVTGEALALGRPVIATRCGGPVAFISPENGILIDVRNDDQLVQAMVNMVAEHHHYGPDAVRRSVGQRFSPGAVAERFSAVYEKIHAD